MVRSKSQNSRADGGHPARIASLETNFINMSQRLDDMDAHIQQIFTAISSINTSLAGVGKIDWKTLIMSASTVALLLIAFTGAVVEPVKSRISYLERDVEKHEERPWHETAGMKIYENNNMIIRVQDHVTSLSNRIQQIENHLYQRTP